MLIRKAAKGWECFRMVGTEFSQIGVLLYHCGTWNYEPFELVGTTTKEMFELTWMMETLTIKDQDRLHGLTYVRLEATQIANGGYGSIQVSKGMPIPT